MTHPLNVSIVFLIRCRTLLQIFSVCRALRNQFYTIYTPFGKSFSSSYRHTRSDFAHNVEVCLVADRYCVETVAHLGEMQCSLLMFFQHGSEIASHRLALFFVEPYVVWCGTWVGFRVRAWRERNRWKWLRFGTTPVTHLFGRNNDNNNPAHEDIADDDSAIYINECLSGSDSLIDKQCYFFMLPR